MRVVRQEENNCVRELVPVEELADPRVTAFLAHLSSDFQPTQLEEMVPIRFTASGVNYLGSYHCLTTSETPDWLICTLVPEPEVLGRVEQNNRQTLFIAVCVVAGAVFAGMYILGASEVMRDVRGWQRLGER